MDATGAGRDWIATLGALADETRVRLLLLLERQELSVTELCGVLQLPQSTVSRHLRVLVDEGWLHQRAEGPSRYYGMAARPSDPLRRLWRAAREPLRLAVAAEHDAERARQVLAQRRTKSEEFFSTSAGQWDAVRAELYGECAGLAGLLALLDPDWTVGDLGCGTGELAVRLSPFVERVIGVDRSRSMLAAARRRAEGIANVELRHGDLESVPLADGEVDAAVLSLVLHYVPEPATVLAEAVRVLRPGGRLLVVDMVEHGRTEYRERMGHVWLGFRESEVRAWLKDAGCVGVRYVALPADARAKGPLLFAAAALRPLTARAPRSKLALVRDTITEREETTE
jgi:SAM-dependent methyltransferase